MNRRTLRFVAGAAVALSLTCAVCAQEATRGKLEVVKASLHQYDGGPPLPSSFEFLAGDTVFLTFRIAGFQTVEKDDEERLQLLYRIESFGPEGLPLKEPEEGATATTLASEDRKQGWMPLVRYDTLVPPSAPSGEYRIVVHVEDRYGDAKTEFTAPFTVKGRDVAPSDTLILRNFHFYRSETSTQPLRQPVYRAGDALWARFDITGYKFGEKNRFSIAYGIKVLRASGSTLFEQPVAAEEERESFYPERHIQGGLSLNLTPDLSAGDYTIIVTVEDRVGEQTYEAKHVFAVQ